MIAKPFMPGKRLKAVPGYALAAALSLVSVMSVAIPTAAVAAAPAPAPAAQAAPQEVNRDSVMASLVKIEKGLEYRTGEIKLEDGLAKVNLPAGYRYLDAKQTETVLTDLWGNPPGSKTLGMILAPGQEPLGDESWAVIIEYEEDGYVKDDDAEKINYDDMLKDMQKATESGNEDRKKDGYAAMHLVGWAEKPYYDKTEHKLHWAKELRVEGSEHTSLNYNIRILGRRGVLVLNAVAPMSALETVKAGIPPVLKSVEFQEGHRYSEFIPGTDKVATYGIAALVAGGVLAKVGFFKIMIGVLLAAKKFIIIGLLAFVAFFKRLFKGPAAQKEIKDVTREMPEETKRG